MKNYKTLFICLLIFNVVFLNDMILTTEKKSILVIAEESITPETPHLNLIQRYPINITSDSDFEIFPGTGTADDPYRIENWNITTSDNRCGINITGTSKHFVIQNCFIEAVNIGIWIFYTAEGTAKIINNTCANNGLYGIDVRFTSHIFISNNVLYNNREDGISCIFSDDLEIENNLCFLNKKNGISLHYCEGSVLVNNTCFNNTNGLEFFNARDTRIFQNYCFNNTENGINTLDDVNTEIECCVLENNLNSGIFCKNSDSINIHSNNCSENQIGIHLQNSLTARVFNNSISDNRGRGIISEKTSNCVIFYNNIIRNIGYGMYLNDSNSNIIHHNNFIENNLGGSSQAYSREGVNNTWYEKETEEGNYWSNHIGVGRYLIEGIPYSYDLYPLSEPTIAPLQSKSPRNKILISTITSSSILFIGIISFLTIYFPRVKRRRKSKHEKVIAYSKDVGVALFRFGSEGDELLVREDFGSLKVNLDVFIGYCYVTIGQGQRYETGVYGPVPAPSLADHNVIIFSFWGNDDVEGDPRMGDKQYYLISVIFPEEKNEFLIDNKTMNERFQEYIKKFEFPNRMTIEELNHFRDIVFIQ